VVSGLISPERLESENRETWGGAAPIFRIMDLDADAFYRALQTRDPRFDGKFFVGVRTTGVYCRPICPARTPRRENVEFHLSAASAQEAGFRPCLRCRPESSPDLGAWRGTSNTVSRALALIEAGALDEGDVEALADRVGVGERQLRRLFRQHLGASPVAVAQTRRVLLAKQLLHETRLPMAQVALASGFGSVRRFNETFQRLFDRPPVALRRQKAVAEEALGGDVTLKLSYRPPYDWPAMVAFLTDRAIPGVETVTPDRYARTLKVGGVAGVVLVEPETGDRLRVTAHFPDLRVLPEVIRRVRRVFDLAADPQAIGAHLSADPLLAPLVAARPGLRTAGAWDGFELAVRAVLGQQVTVVGARTLAGRLAAAFGEEVDDPIARELGLSRLFPDAERLIGRDIAAIGMPRARGAAIAGLAEAAHADRRLFEVGSTLEEATARLTALPGIGEWTAQYIALRAFREPDAFPHADLGLLRAMADSERRRPSPAELLARAEAWRPWRAYAAQHLWAQGSAHGEGRGDREAA
jgi:AraC family transcriptional regulator of adaptative response / DNA-3-methyladenine glycosylase II